MPSTCQLADAEARAARRQPRLAGGLVARVVDTAYWLFSMKKQSGSFQAAARFMVSSVEPMLTAPSPK